MTDRSILQGRRALVTGVTGSIGFAIAMHLLRSGAKVVGVARSGPRLNDASSRLATVGPFEAIVCDLTVDRDLERLTNDARFENLDVLILASGIVHHRSLANSTLAEFDEQFVANVRGPFAVLRAAIPSLVTRRGEVVLVSSSAAIRGRAGAGQYSATQNAMRAIADTLRDELNPEGVRVTTVYPGRTSSERQERIHREEGKPYRPELLLQPSDIAQVVLASLLLPRTAEVTDVHIRPMHKS